MCHASDPVLSVWNYLVFIKEINFTWHYSSPLLQEHYLLGDSGQHQNSNSYSTMYMLNKHLFMEQVSKGCPVELDAQIPQNFRVVVGGEIKSLKDVNIKTVTSYAL